jgi:sialate O-acetylesterase
MLPGAIFNGMISPIIPYSIAGVLWYQGESNVGRAYQYRFLFPLLIQGWRKEWNRKDLPFYFCQVSNNLTKLSAPGESAWAELRESQSKALVLPHTAQAVTIDLGEAGDFHFRDKKTVGERLLLIANAEHYGGKAVCSGPVYKSMTIEPGAARIQFDNTGDGLIAKNLPLTYIIKSLLGQVAPLVRNSPNSELEGFAICGENHNWFWADAKIDHDSVLVWSAKVPHPVAVRYAWSDNPTCNLYNRAALPAAPFRTDDFPVTSEKSHY